MENRTADTKTTGDGAKFKGIHRWLEKVKLSEPPEEQPPFNERGEPLHPNQKKANRPRVSTCSEIKDGQRMNGNAPPVAVKKPNQARQAIRHGSLTVPRKPSSITSSHSGPGRDVFVAVDGAGQRKLSTNERFIELQEGEEIDPTGRRIDSTCPTVIGRRKVLSRSNAIKEPPLNLAEHQPDLQMDGNAVSHHVKEPKDLPGRASATQASGAEMSATRVTKPQKACVRSKFVEHLEDM